MRQIAAAILAFSLSVFGVSAQPVSTFVQGTTVVTPYLQGVAFRATSGFVTDASGIAYDLGNNDSANYPITPLCNGCGSTGSATSYGWFNRALIGGCNNVSAGIDHRIAGDCFSPSGSALDFMLSAPAGTYNVALGFNDLNGSPAVTTITILDGHGGATLATIGPSVCTTTNIAAADNNCYTRANWATTGSTVTISVTESSGVLDFNIAAGVGAINFLSVSH